jgi:hypothetical protein
MAMQQDDDHVRQLGHDEAPPGGVDRTGPGAGTAMRLLWVEAVLATVAFAALCVVVLSVAPQIAEPDNGAYHHSIVAITLGDPLTLSRPQLDALDATLGNPVGRVPNQWVEVADGRYISVPDCYQTESTAADARQKTSLRRQGMVRSSDLMRVE